MGTTVSRQSFNARRRTMLVRSLIGASTLVVMNGQSLAQPMESKGKIDRMAQKPVDSMIPGFRKVRLREMTYAPGASGKAKMQNAMICECTRGSLEVTADDKTFTVNKGDIWTCSAGMVEAISNKASGPGTMRVFDLLTA